MSLRAKKQAEEARAVTDESQQCQAELRRHGILVRDFQVEVNDVGRESQLTGSTSRGSQSDSIRTYADSDGADSDEDEDEIVMMGRKHVDTGCRADLRRG